MPLAVDGQQLPCLQWYEGGSYPEVNLGILSGFSRLTYTALVNIQEATYGILSLQSLPYENGPEMEAVLDMAKVTSKGQVTIPKAIRAILGLKTGDRVLFAAKPDGSITLRNATLQAFDDLQAAFAGAAEEVGIETEDDVVGLVREVRAERAAAR